MAVAASRCGNIRTLRLTVASGVEELDECVSLAGRTASIDLKGGSALSSNVHWIRANMANLCVPSKVRERGA